MRNGEVGRDLATLTDMSRGLERLLTFDAASNLGEGIPQRGRSLVDGFAQRRTKAPRLAL